MERGERFFAKHKTAVATAMLIGTIVGAGILGIPYVVAKAGFLWGFLLILGIGVAFVFLNLFLGEIVLRTREQHQLPGYAGKYLGRWGKRIMTFSMFIGLYGALTAYLIGEGATLHSIFRVGSPLLYTLLFFSIVAFIIHRGIKATGNAELILILLLFAVVVLIGMLSYSRLNAENFNTLNPTYFFLPYGVILFAFIGSPAIPELQEEVGAEKKRMKKAILVGSLLPIALYLLFTFIIVGMVGVDQFELLAPNQRIATVALSLYANPLLGILANFLAVLAMFTSFLTIGIALTEIYSYDYGISRRRALLLTLALPLLLAISGQSSFIGIIGMAGALGGGLDGILIVLMYWRAKLLGDRAPEYSLGKHYGLGSLLLLLFALGIVYQLWNVFF